MFTYVPMSMVRPGIYAAWGACLVVRERHCTRRALSFQNVLSIAMPYHLGSIHEIIVGRIMRLVGPLITFRWWSARVPSLPGIGLEVSTIV